MDIKLVEDDKFVISYWQIVDMKSNRNVSFFHYFSANNPTKKL